MQAQDIMTRDVVPVRLGTPVPEIAELLIRHRIRGVPAIDAERHVLGKPGVSRVEDHTTVPVYS